MSNKPKVDEFYCKKCQKSMVGSDGFCVNCGHDTTSEADPFYEDEDSNDIEDVDMSDLDFGDDFDE